MQSLLWVLDSVLGMERRKCVWEGMHGYCLSIHLSLLKLCRALGRSHCGYACSDTLHFVLYLTCFCKCKSNSVCMSPYLWSLTSILSWN